MIGRVQPATGSGMLRDFAVIMEICSPNELSIDVPGRCPLGSGKGAFEASERAWTGYAAQPYRIVKENSSGNCS